MNVVHACEASRFRALTRRLFQIAMVAVAAIAAAPKDASAMGAAPAYLYASTSLSTTEVEVIPAGTVVPVDFRISDAQLEGHAYPYELTLSSMPTIDGGWGDTIDMPASVVVNYPGEVIVFPGSITASAATGTHSYYFQMVETSGATIGIRTCYPISFAIGAPTPTSGTSGGGTPKGKGGGKRR
jgi:hypothetical protein